jgi:hypothetical protein
MLRLAALDPITTEGRYKRIPVVLQPQTNSSNGMVTLAPYKSELLLQPHENVFELGSLPWADLLSLHEYRHVQHINAVNNGLSHIVKVIAGDLAYSAVYSLALPQWFREGNSVFTETKWSPQGRGRLSHFMLPTHERLLTEEPWRFFKALRGSYKQVTPDVYALGFLMQMYGNASFGEEAWDTIVRRAARLRNPVSPFAARVRDYYGDWSRGIYRDASYWLRDRYRAMAVEEVHYPVLAPDSTGNDRRFRQDDFLDYAYPMCDRDGKVYTTVSTFDHIPAIYAIDATGSARRLRILGQKQDGHFHAANGKLVWTELRLDPRWLRRDRNVIVLFDTQTRRRRIFRPEKGYAMPSLDETGDRIAALHTDMAGRYAVRILDARSGEVIRTLPNPDNLYFGYPVFDAGGSQIVTTARLNDGRMCLMAYDLATGESETLTTPTYSVLGRPSVQGNWIYLTAGYGRLDQVYAVDRTTHDVFRVSGGNRAHYNPAVDPVTGDLICSEYRLDGSKLVRVDNDTDQWVRVIPTDTIRHMTFPGSRNLVTEALPEPAAEVRKYSQWSHAVNPHSLFVQVNDPIWQLMIRSDNLLNSISSSAGVEYNRNLQAYGPFVNVRLAMWYPELNLGVKQIYRTFRDAQDEKVRTVNSQVFAGLRVPLRTTAGAWDQYLSVGPTYTFGDARDRGGEGPDGVLQFDYMEHELLFINGMRRGYRQAVPFLAQRLNITHAHQVAKEPVSQWYGTLALAFPSFFTTHYVLMKGEYAWQPDGKSLVSIGSKFDGARGFDHVDGREQYYFGLTYGLPLLYPDIGFGGVMFTQRIRMQTFLDVSHTLQFDHESYYQASAGIELIVDSSWLPLSFGFRYARLFHGPTDTRARFELFIPQIQF